MKISNDLHKEAVQDAVDIIQSKRLDFIETKSEEIDVAGILISLFIIFSFELGVVGFLFSEIASRLASSALFKAVSNAMLKFIGSRNRKAVRDTLQSLAKKVADDKALIKKVDEELSSDSLLSFARADLKRKRKNFEFDLNKSEEAVKNIDMNKLALDIGKKTYDSMLNTFKKVSDKLEPDLRVISKDVVLEGEENIHKLDKNKSEQHENIVPIDVYFKACIQNLREEEVLIIGDLINLTKMLLTEAELNIDLDQERIQLHNEILKNVPPLESLSGSLKDLQNYFNEGFDYATAKDTQTIEYEFMIWSLMLVNKVKVRPVITDDPTGIGASAIENVLPGSTTRNILKVSIEMEVHFKDLTLI
jgi:hypothetical protein